MQKTDSQIVQLNDLLSSCSDGKRFQIVFYHTSKVNSYTDCRDGFVYADKTANIPKTGNVCIVLADIFAKNIKLIDFASSCNSTTMASIDLILNNLQIFEIGPSGDNSNSAEKLFTSPATLCDSFYSLTVYDAQYNKFALFKSLNYQQGTECARSSY